MINQLALLVPLVNLHQRRIALLGLQHRRVNDENDNGLHWIGVTRVVRHGVVTARPFDEMLTRLVDLRRVPIHAAEELAFQHVGNGSGTGMAMWWAGPVGLVYEFQCDNRLARTVGELVVVEDLEILSRSCGSGRFMRMISRAG